MNYWLKGFLVTCLMIFTDIIWAKYTIYVNKREPLTAALLSTAIILTGSFTVIIYTQEHSMIWFSALGAFIGTFLAVWEKKVHTWTVEGNGIPS